MKPMYQKFEEDFGVSMTAEVEEFLWRALEDAIFGGTIKEELSQAASAMVLEPGDLGENIREMRVELGLPPIEAAKRARVSSARWLNWEGNAEIPSEEELVRMTRVLYETGRTASLYQCHRRAPIGHLRRFFGKDPLRGISGGEEKIEGWKLKLLRLDARARHALEKWCFEQGYELEDGVAQVCGMTSRERLGAIQEMWEGLV